MENASGFEVPTWDQIYNMLLNQAEKIRKSCFNPDIIVGIARGGWLPARVMSDLLENPNLANVRTESSYHDAENKIDTRLTQCFSTSVKAKKVLLLDEVADTGRSLTLVKKQSYLQGAGEVKIATLYVKPWSVVEPDYYEKQTPFWIVFPWEIKETIRRITEKCRNKRVSIEKQTTKLVSSGLPKQLLQNFLKEIGEERKCSSQ
jgi:hypoxanthine phosphoribosyltransferase